MLEVAAALRLAPVTAGQRLQVAREMRRLPATAAATPIRATVRPAPWPATGRPNSSWTAFGKRAGRSEVAGAGALSVSA